MRTGKISKKEVVAVVLKDIPKLQHSVNMIQLAITKGEFRKSSEPKHILDPNKSDYNIVCNINHI